MPKKFSSWLEVAAAVVVCVLSDGVLAQQAGPPAATFASNRIASLDNSVPIGYFVADDRAADDGSAPGSNAELCIWALDDWIRHSDGRLGATPSAEDDALIRVYFVSPGAGRYGEMRPILVNGKRGAEVYVRTETDTLGPDIAGAARQDPLFRETVVYLTCLHEIGHALGMLHTDQFEDVMYYFGFGGDIPAFFHRYRSKLGSRADIRRQSGLSSGDRAQLLAAYPAE